MVWIGKQDFSSTSLAASRSSKRETGTGTAHKGILIYSRDTPPHHPQEKRWKPTRLRRELTHRRKQRKRKKKALPSDIRIPPPPPSHHRGQKFEKVVASESDTSLDNTGCENPWPSPRNTVRGLEPQPWRVVGFLCRAPGKDLTGWQRSAGARCGSPEGGKALAVTPSLGGRVFSGGWLPNGQLSRKGKGGIMMGCYWYCHVVVIGLLVTRNFTLVKGSNTPGEQRLLSHPILLPQPLSFPPPSPPPVTEKHATLWKTTKLGYAASSLGRAGP